MTSTTSVRPTGVARVPVTGPNEVVRRIGWVVLAACCAAFGIFEAAKHGGATWGMFFLGAIGPDIPLFVQPVVRGGHQRGQLARAIVPFYNTLHFWLLPLVVIVFFSFYGTTNDQSAPGFTLGLLWLAHIAVDRVLGYGLRGRDGWQRRGVPSPDRTIGNA